MNNRNFIKLCPIFTKAHVSDLEQQFLRLLNYDVSVSSRLYAKYFFELHAMCQQFHRTLKLQSLTVQQARQLEVRHHHRYYYYHHHGMMDDGMMG